MGTHRHNRKRKVPTEIREKVTPSEIQRILSPKIDDDKQARMQICNLFLFTLNEHISVLEKGVTFGTLSNFVLFHWVKDVIICKKEYIKTWRRRHKYITNWRNFSSFGIPLKGKWHIRHESNRSVYYWNVKVSPLLPFLDTQTFSYLWN